MGLFFCADFKTCSNGKKKKATAYVAAVVVAVCIIFLVVSILWWKYYLKGRKKNRKGENLMKTCAYCFVLPYSYFGRGDNKTEKLDRLKKQNRTFGFWHLP